MNVVALIPAAGTGERFGAPVPKPLVELCGRPVIAYALAVFERIVAVKGVILIVHPDFMDDYRRMVAQYAIKKILVIVEGGDTRTRSVRKGLVAVPPSTDYVIVHDGARPVVTAEIIERGLKLVASEKAVVAAVPVKPTVKSVDPRTNVIRETLDRTLLWEIQTPQIFERKLLERAYAGDVEATDDAALVERLGIPVKIFPGDCRNVKITTPEDLVVAEALMGISANR